MMPAPFAAAHMATATASGSLIQPLNNDSTDFRTMPLNTNSSRIPPSAHATTIPTMSLVLDSCIARKVFRVGGLAAIRVAVQSATGLYANINPHHTAANPRVINHEFAVLNPS